MRQTLILSPSQCRRRSVVLLLLLQLLHLLSLTTITLITPCTARNSAPMFQFNQMQTKIASCNLTTRDTDTMDLAISGALQFYPSLYSGIALPLSNRLDFTIDMNIMLPHKDDDIFACSLPLRTQNEFNQTYKDAWIIMEQSACAEERYGYAAASGARGVIVMGCAPAPPYNCDPSLQQVLVARPIASATVISVTYADGKRMVDYLNSKKALANGAPIPKDTLAMTIKSAGPLAASERQALIAIMTNTSMTSFLQVPTLDILPYWRKGLFEDTTWDPCLNRTKGIWCEGNNIVLINLNYHFWETSHGIPPEIADLTELRYFSVDYNLWTGDLPKRFCELKKLKVLWIGQQLAPPGITSLPDCEWPAMEELVIEQNSITVLPSSMSKWTNLKRLYAQKNLVTFLPSFANLTNLEYLDLSSNKISGTIPTLSKSAPLKVVALGTNQLSGQIPTDAFDGLSQLEVLDLNTNRFTGKLPHMVGCTSLRILDLSSQRDLSHQSGGFTDDFPRTYFLLQKLQELYLQENSLYNTYELTISTMVSLTILDLSHNQFRLIPFVSQYPLGAVSDMLRDMMSPSLTILRLNHNNYSGPFGIPDPTFMQTIRKIYLNDNHIASIFREVFSTGVVHLDLSNNEIESSYFTQGFPGKDFEYLNLQGNPKLIFDDLPAWADPITTRVQLANQSYACQSLSVNTAVAMTFLVDPTFFQYKYCECQAGTFGKAPLCNVVPNNADLNPFSVISSKEIGDAFSTLIESAGGIGSNLTQTNPQNNVIKYAQAFSDSMYGENRLAQGLFTSWTIDLTNLYSDDIDLLLAQGTTPPTIPAVYHPTASSDIHSEWTPVRSITVRLHISGTTFTQFDDAITILSGGADLKGDRIMTILGTDEKPVSSSSSYTITADYQQQHHTSIMAVSDPRLIEVQIFSPIATVQFTSRQTSGLHFYATYSYDFVCPSGFFYDRLTNLKAPKCRENYEIYSVDADLRNAVIGVSAVAMALAALCIIFLGFYWNHGVFRAASRSFMLLILVMMESMALGAMLYAAVPENSTSRGSAVCIGRAWLTCLPLAAILSIMFAKNRRLWAIFGATKLQVKTHSDLDLLVTVLIISALQCVLLAVFSGLPLSKPALELGKGSLNSMLVTSCSQESGFMSWIGAEIAFIAALMLPTAYLGFKTRNLPSQFNESAHLQNALILLMFFMAIIIPLDIFIQNDPGSAVLLQGLGQSFLTIMLTLIIFGPKIWFVMQSSDVHGGHGHATKKTNSNVGMKHSSTPITPADYTAPVVAVRNRQGSLDQQQQQKQQGRLSTSKRGSLSTGEANKTTASNADRRSFPLTATPAPVPRQPLVSERAASASVAVDSLLSSLQLTVTAPEETNPSAAAMPVTHDRVETRESKAELTEIQPQVQ